MANWLRKCASGKSHRDHQSEQTGGHRQLACDRGQVQHPNELGSATPPALIGCGSGKLVVFDTNAGKPIASLDIASEPDGVSFDAKRRLLYISYGQGSLDVVRQNDANHLEFVTSIPTAKGAATSIFLPELDRSVLAVPQRDSHNAEIRLYAPMDRRAPFTENQ
jgi:hypothetical protein